MSARGKIDVGTLAISSIRRDGGTQIRAGLDEDTVQEYTDLIKAGAKFPPVGVYQEGPLQEGTPFWLWDGFHRVEAYSRAGVERIKVEFRSGTRRDALRAACGANADHGLKRSNADKRRAVETFLSDPEWQQWSDGAIAKEANVSRQTVTNIRGELAISPVGPRVVKGLDGRERLQPKPAQGQPSGQPTPGPISPGNPKADGEEGAGASDEEVRDVAPAPDEPRDRLINVERMLCDAQAEIGPLIATGAALDVLVALNDALAVVRRALEPAIAPLSPEGRAEFAQVLVEERLLTAADAPRVVSAGWPEPKSPCPPLPAREKKKNPAERAPAIVGYPPMPLCVNGRMLRPGWAPCKGGDADTGHVPSSDPRSGDCERCGRFLFVVVKPKAPRNRIILDTPSGEIPYEDISQAEPSDAG